MGGDFDIRNIPEKSAEFVAELYAFNNYQEIETHKYNFIDGEHPLSILSQYPQAERKRAAVFMEQFIEEADRIHRWVLETELSYKGEPLEAIVDKSLEYFNHTMKELNRTEMAGRGKTYFFHAGPHTLALNFAGLPANMIIKDGQFIIIDPY